MGTIACNHVGKIYHSILRQAKTYLLWSYDNVLASTFVIEKDFRNPPYPCPPPTFCHVNIYAESLYIFSALHCLIVDIILIRITRSCLKYKIGFKKNRTEKSISSRRHLSRLLYLAIIYDKNDKLLNNKCWRAAYFIQIEMTSV